MNSKLPLMAFTWSLALLASLALRVWGLKHPEAFLIRPFLIWLLLFAPSFVLGIWLVWYRQTNLDMEGSSKLTK